jgi:DnaJ-class molecular chaperone
VPQIEISIAVDEHLQLQVKAQDLATGHSKSFNRIDLIPLALSTGGESTTLPTGRETAVPLAEDGASSTAASDSGDKKADQNAGPDASGFDWSQWTTGGPGGPRANVHYGDIDDLLGEGSFSKIFGNAFSGRAQRKPRTQAVEHSLTISLEEAALGTERVLAIDQGDGQQKRLTARIPGGVRTGSKVRFSGAFGETGQDLYLVITVADHPLYQRSGDDLLLEYPLAQKRGPFGRSIQVPLLEGGKASTPLPAKISAGMEVKVAGKGACKLRTEGRGDLRVILQPYDPSAMRPEMLEQVKRIKAALGR